MLWRNTYNYCLKTQIFLLEENGPPTPKIFQFYVTNDKICTPTYSYMIHNFLIVEQRKAKFRTSKHGKVALLGWDSSKFSLN